jgi:hypothetical protein
MALHLHSFTFDAPDPQALAGFWAGVTGYQGQTVNEFVAILSGDGSLGPGLMFIKVPEDKSAKNRMHVDLGSPDLESETQRVLDLGAELVGRYDEYGVTWASFLIPRATSSASANTSRHSTDAQPVRAEGLEPPSPEGHRLLRPARLPVPPRSLAPSLPLRQLR